MADQLRELILPVRSEYFDAIRDGGKLEEFRLQTPFWARRLVGREFSSVVLTKGYPRREDASRRLRREWRGYRLAEITHPHFGNEPVSVFAIDVSRPATGKPLP